MSTAQISGEVRRLTAVPLVAAWLDTKPEWTAITNGITNIQAALNQYRAEAQAANTVVEKLQTEVIDVLLTGKPVPAALPKTAGTATRAAQDLEAAWNVAGRVRETLTWLMDAWPRDNADAILEMLRTSIDRSVSAGRAVAKKIGSASTPESAARAGVFRAWEDLEAAHVEYSEAKYAHRYLMEATEDSEPLRSIFWIFRNADTLYPNHLTDGQVKAGPGRTRPWPEDIYGLEHFLWICRHPEAEPWAPSTDDIRQVVTVASEPPRPPRRAVVVGNGAQSLDRMMHKLLDHI